VLGRAVYSHARALDAFTIYAHLAVARAVLGFTVDRVAAAGSAALIRRTLDFQAAGRETFLVDTDLSQAGAGPRGAVVREAKPAGAGLVGGAVDAQAVGVDALALVADESFWAFVVGTVGRELLTVAVQAQLARGAILVVRAA
jgi:hypothetical protein